MARLLFPMSLLSLLCVGAIFGFFYAWVCSTMWGLDAASPEVAIAAMQAMNASVRNAVFFPAFFLTPAFLAATALIAAKSGRRASALWFGAGAATYLIGAFLVTAAFNVPMNEALALVAIPEDAGAAARIWRDYSQPWQFWNIVRTIASGGALLFTGLAIFQLVRKTA